MVKKNLGWIRDTLYSNVSTKCVLQRVSDRHGENSSLYSLVVDHLCGHLPGERADWSISVNLAAERDKLTKPSLWLVTREEAMYAASTSFLFLFSIFVCRAVSFSQRGKCPCSSACNTRELVVLWCRRLLLCSFNFLSIPRFTIVHGRTADIRDGVHHTFSPRVIIHPCTHYLVVSA